MPTFHERLVPTAGFWALAPGAGVFAGAALLPVDAILAMIAAVVATLAVVIGLWRGAAVVEVTETVVSAGRARLPLAVVGGVEQLDAGLARTALGTDLDARAYVLTRPWIRTAVRIHVTDPADPTPYWLVSTRRPGALAAALGAGRGGAQPAHSEQTS